MTALEPLASHLRTGRGADPREASGSSAFDAAAGALVFTCDNCKLDFLEPHCDCCGAHLKYDGRVSLPIPERAHAPEGV